ncbi:unnamed protein product [Effrenium voratum]|nr:unnamed protein product [Effrenium voratum]CAJ1461897.1 unnamed protein product [Effrenium voratum]
MESWQFKTDLSEDEANWENQTLSDWLLLGPAASRRCSLAFVGEKFYLTTSPCVAFKWQVMNVDDSGVILKRPSKTGKDTYVYMMTAPVQKVSMKLSCRETNAGIHVSAVGLDPYGDCGFESTFIRPITVSTLLVHILSDMTGKPEWWTDQDEIICLDSNGVQTRSSTTIEQLARAKEPAMKRPAKAPPRVAKRPASRR